jgi:hypothetical protein
MSDHLRGYVGYVIAESVIPVAYMKSLKIPIRIRISKKNTMAKRKKYKRTNNDLQNIHTKLKIE